MSETWYRAWYSFNEIVPVDISKHTDNTVWMGSRRFARKSDHQSYFPSWEEAHGYLLTRADEELAHIRAMLARAQGKHGNIKGMKKPADKASGSES